MSIVNEIKAAIKADNDAIENGGEIFELKQFLKKKKTTYEKFCAAGIPVIAERYIYDSCFEKIENFQKYFHRHYPVFENFDYSNVLIAGGIFSGLTRRRSTRSDVDLFIYGLDEEGAYQKLREIYEHVRNSSMQEIRVYVSKMSFTMLTSSGRKIQIILRRFNSIAHVLNSFDLGSSAVGYDGEKFLVSSLGLFAWTHSVNLINPRRFSPGYVVRLMKYLRRDFAIALHDVDNEKIVESVKIANYKILVKQLDEKALYAAIQTVRLPAEEDAENAEVEEDVGHVMHEYDVDFAEKLNCGALDYYRNTGKVFPVVTAHGDYDELFKNKILLPEEIQKQYENEVINLMRTGIFSKCDRTLHKLFPEIKPNVFLSGFFAFETNEERAAYIRDIINKEVEKLAPIFDVKLPNPVFVYREENTSIITTPKTAEELYGQLLIQ